MWSLSCSQEILDKQIKDLFLLKDLCKFVSNKLYEAEKTKIDNFAIFRGNNSRTYDAI